jgi:hypothetical protein
MNIPKIPGFSVGFSPALLDSFSLQMKNALSLAENVPPYVRDAAENFRQSIRRWSQEVRDTEANNVVKEVSNGC